MPQAILELKEPVRSLTWTHDHRLLVFTADRVQEWPSGRSAGIPPLPEPMFELPFDVRQSASGTQAIVGDFVIDTKTFKTSKLEGEAFWDGDELVRIERDDSYRTYFLRGEQRVLVANGRYVTGLSDDGRYALVTSEPPIDRVETSLMKIDTKSGKGTVVAKFPMSSTDHTKLGRVDYNQKLGFWLIHSVQVSFMGYQPFIAGSELKQVDLGQKIGSLETSCALQWLETGSAWTFANRRFFEEEQNGSVGLDARSFDLYNVETRKLIRLIEKIDRWNSNGGKTDARGDEPAIATPAIDWQNKRLAYTVQTGSSSTVYLLSFSDRVN